MDLLTKVSDGLKGAYEQAKSAVQGPAQTAVDTTGLSKVTVPGVAAESPGMTTTGGKRSSRRTRRSKKSKKTLRRRK